VELSQVGASGRGSRVRGAGGDDTRAPPHPECSLRNSGSGPPRECRY
jgi:hypothetical protein